MGSGNASENRQYNIEGGVSELYMPTIFSTFQLSSIHKISKNAPESRRQPISSPSRVSHKLYVRHCDRKTTQSAKIIGQVQTGEYAAVLSPYPERRDVADWAANSDCIFQQFLPAYHVLQKTCIAVTPEETLGPSRSQKHCGVVRILNTGTTSRQIVSCVSCKCPFSLIPDERRSARG